MMHGNFSADLTPVIRLTLIGVNNREAEVDAAVDTGFNGALTLSAALIQELGWPCEGKEEAVLADGKKLSVEIYRGIVMWNGNPRIVDVMVSEIKPLIGLVLFEGHVLRMDVVRGGEITIIERERGESLP